MTLFSRPLLLLVFACACSLLFAGAAGAFPSKAGQEHPSSATDWQSFLRQGETDKSEAVCKKLLEQKSQADRVEGHKCMANTILYKSRTGGQDMAGQTGGAPHMGWTREGADAAIEQLELAMRMATDDLSLHQMRLFILLRSGQAEKAPQALEDSLQRYTGKESFDPWLSFTREFWETKAYDPGLQYLKVLAEKYPNNPKLLSNLAAFAARGGQPDKALEYAEKAIELQPDNPRHYWNMAGIYEKAGDLEKADSFFLKALALFKDPESADAAWCSYAMFVKESLHDAKRAEELIAKHCKKGSPQQGQ